MSTEGPFRAAALENGDRLEVSLADGIRVRRTRVGRVISELPLDEPSAGVGGGAIYVSPNCRYAAIAMFSGQSEERYDLVSLEGGLTWVAGMEYEFGEGATYGFSADETTVVMALPNSCIQWWLPWSEGDADENADGSASFQFGRLRFHHIQTGAVTIHEL